MHFDIILGPAGLEDEKFRCYGFGRNDGRERSVCPTSHLPRRPDGSVEPDGFGLKV